VFWASLPDIALPVDWYYQPYTLNLDTNPTTGDAYTQIQAIIDQQP
jgi:hypothetical protein